jgi:tetratricopeptide (TPR) repeat protein
MKFILYSLPIVASIIFPIATSANPITATENTSTTIVETASQENKAQFYNNRGLEKYQKQDLQGALEDINLAIATDPQNALLYFNRGYIKSSSFEDYSGALEDYNKAIQLNPNFAEAIAQRAFVKEKLQDFYGSLADYNLAIELSPPTENLYLERGMLEHLQLGHHLKALDDYDKAIDLDPQDAYNYGFRGLVKKDLGDIEGAIADLNLGVSLAKEQRNTELVRLLEESLRTLNLER